MTFDILAPSVAWSGAIRPSPLSSSCRMIRTQAIRVDSLLVVSRPTLPLAALVAY
jgi:hypothetical protein